MLIQYMASVVVFELHRTCSHSLSGCIGHGFPLVESALLLQNARHISNASWKAHDSLSLIRIRLHHFLYNGVPHKP
jgi:hypothetical protein